jgi:recombination associated protein RdgC
LGILASSVSITRYKVEGTLSGPAMETILSGLKKNAIEEIDQEVTEKAVGWTSLNKPFFPDFDASSFVVGSYILFSLRIDSKRVAAKVIQKHTAIETAKKLTESGRNYLSREEKRMLKDHVTNMLYRRVPAVPSIHDVLWNMEEGYVWLFSNQKAANEAVETLFLKSFNLTLIQMYPYTLAYFNDELSSDLKDVLSTLSPTNLWE